MKRFYKIIALCCSVILIMCSSVVIGAESIVSEDLSQYKVVTKSYENDKVVSKVVIPSDYSKTVNPESLVTPARMPLSKASDILEVPQENLANTTNRTMDEVEESEHPYCAIGRIESKWRMSATEVYVVKGTGCLEGPDVVLTCAHVVWDEELGWSDETWFYPGQTSDTTAGRPIQSEAISISIAQSYIDSGRDDWAILQVEDDLGYLGWFGKAVATSAQIGVEMVSSGYRGDAGGRQLKTRGIVQRIAADYDDWNIHLSGIEASYGHSGAPVYHESNGIVRGILNFGGGFADGGGRAIDSWLYQALQEAYLEGVEKWGY